MNLIELKKMIDDRLEVLSKPHVFSKKYNFIKEFLSKNKISSANDIRYVDAFELAGALFCLDLESDEIDEEEIALINEDSRNLYETLSMDDFMKIINFANELHEDENNLLIEVVIYLKTSNQGFIDKYTEVFNGTPFPLLRKKIDEDNLSFYRAFDIINKENELASRYFGVIIDVYTLKYLYSNFDAGYDVVKNMVSGKLKRKARKKDSVIKKSINMVSSESETRAFMNNVKRLETFVYEEEKKASDFEKTRGRESNNLNKALSLLEEALKAPEITNASEIVSLVKDEDLKRAFLDIIYNHNRIYNNEIETEYRKLAEDDFNKYKTLLIDSYIDFDKNDVLALMDKDYNSLKEMIALLKPMNFSASELLFVLRKSNLEVVSTIKKYTDRGFVSTDFLKDNIAVFIPGGEKLLFFTTNVDILENRSINPSVFKNNLGLLLLDPEEFKNRINILDSYQLVSSLKNASDLDFVKRDDLEEVLDLLLELGFEDVMVEDMNILNNKHIKRLELLKGMDIIIEDKEMLMEVLNRKNFFVEDDNIDEYLISSADYHKEVSFDKNLLPAFQSGIRTYDINGVLISIPKVKRALNNGKTLYEAIFTNTHFSEEEYDIIVNSLSDYKTI